MPDSTSPGPPEPSRRDQPARRDLIDVYRRTWELELLISGAVVFALLQLPGAVDSWFFRVENRVGVGMQTLTFLGYYVSKLILYTLIAAFLTHLCTRALWVGLIGLDSVFPGGIVWERSEAGPILKEIKREQTPSLSIAIERADAVASVIFSAAFAMVLMFILIAVVSAVVGAVAVVAGFWLGEAAIPRVFWILYMAFFIPPAIAQMLDKGLAGKLDPGAPLARAIERVVLLFYRLTGPIGRMSEAITSTIGTNLPRGRGTAGLLTALALLFAVFLVRDVMLSRGVIQLDGYRYFTDFDGPDAVLPSFYESTRGEERSLTLVPSIQSEVVTEPYVRLFIPVAAARLTAVVETLCPGAEPVHDGGLRLTRRPRVGEAPAYWASSAAVLDCIEGIQRVELDGELQQPDLLFHVHAGSGQRGFLARFPTAGLAPGRHTLTVHRLPRPEEARAMREGTDPAEASDTPQPAAPWVIPFWR